MPWSDDFSVGLPDIDAQHRYFLEMIEKVDDIIKSGVDRRYLQPTLQELARYARYHFATENMLMGLYDFPERDRHMAEHDAILRVLERHEGGAEPPAKLRMFLYKWFVAHTTLEDKRLADHVSWNREHQDGWGAIEAKAV